MISGRRSTWLGALLVASGALWPTGNARAAELDAIVAEKAVTEEPKTVVRPLYTMNGKVDIGLLGGMSVSDRLVAHTGGAVAFDYQLTELLSAELFGAFGQSKLVGLTDDIREQTKQTAGPDLVGSGKPAWTGQVGARFTPLYGKFNIASEWSIHFHFYVMAGVGAAQVAYESVLAKVPNPKGDPKYIAKFTDSSVGAAGNIGLGVRLWMNKVLSLRVEARQLFYADQFVKDITAGTAEYSGALGQMPLIYAGLGVTL